VKSEEQSAWVVVIASLSAACILLSMGTMFVAASDALPAFATLAVVLAFAAAALSGSAPRDRQSLVVASLAAAFWALGLWVLWRTWRVAGGVYDHLFPQAAHDRFWRVAFQLVSIPIVALALQLALVGLLVVLNRIAIRRRRLIQERRSRDLG
jgi:hypothetical protein